MNSPISLPNISQRSLNLDQQEPIYNGNLSLSERTLDILCVRLFILGLILLIILVVVRMLFTMPVSVRNY